jgi:4-hydroxy-2-oxoheptanedioate aldolase
MKFREKIAGGPQLGFCVMYPSPGVIERVGSDWDWIWIDGQHGQIGYTEMLNLVRACDLVQRASLVRVPGHEFGSIGLALDAGASGVIVPCVDTPEQAQQIVNAAKFPPVGKRSYGGRRPIDFQGREYSDSANDDVLLICQIESPEAVENVDKIAAIEGVDALFLGPDDVLLRRGIPMTAPRSREMLAPDLESVMNACRKYNKIGVMVGFGEMAGVCAEMGFSLIVSGGDVPFLANSSRQASNEARAIIARQQAAPMTNGDAPNSPY